MPQSVLLASGLYSSVEDYALRSSCAPSLAFLEAALGARLEGGGIWGPEIRWSHVPPSPGHLAASPAASGPALQAWMRRLLASVTAPPAYDPWNLIAERRPLTLAALGDVLDRLAARHCPAHTLASLAEALTRGPAVNEALGLPPSSPSPCSAEGRVVLAAWALARLHSPGVPLALPGISLGMGSSRPVEYCLALTLMEELRLPAGEPEPRSLRRAGEVIGYTFNLVLGAAVLPPEAHVGLAPRPRCRGGHAGGIFMGAPSPLPDGPGGLKGILQAACACARKAGAAGHVPQLLTAVTWDRLTSTLRFGMAEGDFARMARAEGGPWGVVLYRTDSYDILSYAAPLDRAVPLPMASSAGQGC
jgi:hypothetical protein